MKIFGKCFRCMAWALLLFFSCAVTADEDELGTGDRPAGDEESAQDETSEDPFPLPEIQVRTRARQLPATQPVRVVSRADIEAWNSKTAASALTRTPGVNVLVGGSTATASPWIRGYRDRDILITYDGIPFGDSLEGAVDLNQVALQRISRIRVLKNAPSVIFGSGAPGGVILIEPDNAVPQGYFADGEAGFGTDHRRFAQADIGRGGLNGHWAVSAQYDAVDDYSLSDRFPGALNQPPGRRVNSDYQRRSLLFQASFEESPLGESRLMYNFAEDEFGLPLEAGVPDPDFERILLSRRNTLGFSNAFRKLPVSVKLYLNQYDYELGVYDDVSYTELLETEQAEDTSYGARAFSVFEWLPSNTLVWMASAQQNHFETPGDPDRETSEYALAVENQYELPGRFSLAAGLIYSRFDQALEGRTVDSLDPQAALGWRLTDYIDIHASAAQRTRFPKIRELYRNRYGNPNLTEQTSIKLETGLTVRHTSGLQSDLSVFRDRIDGLIERPNRRVTYMNLGEVVYQGVEAASGGWLSESHFTRISLAWLDAEETLPAGGTRQLRSRPEQVWTAEYRFRFLEGSQISVTAVHVKGLHDLDADDEYLELDPYWVVDFKFSHRLGRGLTAYLALSNVADEEYQQRYGYPREGRQFMLGLSYSKPTGSAPWASAP